MDTKSLSKNYAFKYVSKKIDIFSLKLIIDYELYNLSKKLLVNFVILNTYHVLKYYTESLMTKYCCQ